MADKNSLTLAQIAALVKLAKKVDQFNNLLSGNGSPGDIGTNGDWYVDVLTKRLYGPKTETGWAATPVAIGTSDEAGAPRSTAPRTSVNTDGTLAAGVGPEGPQGPQGEQGPTGPAGPTGADGATGATGPAGATGATGPQGPAGADGADGADGATGPQGPAGATGATGPAGATGATGATGAAGADGADGADGAAATIAVGTVSTGAVGSSVTVTNSGSSSAAVFDFAIPRGATGITGSQGPAGPGISAGGTSGQLLQKASGTDYDTSWVDAPSGAVADGAIYENSQTITSSYSITSGKNAMSAGPISVSAGATVTIPSGSNWVVL